MACCDKVDGRSERRDKDPGESPFMPVDLNVLLVAAEVHPLVKTGGLADVVSALPTALQRHNVDARVLMPAYRGIRDQLELKPVGKPFQALASSDKVRLLSR